MGTEAPKTDTPPAAHEPRVPHIVRELVIFLALLGTAVTFRTMEEGELAGMALGGALAFIRPPGGRPLPVGTPLVLGIAGGVVANAMGNV